MAINKIRYLDRIEAGHQLLDAIKPMADPQAVILALPRGGVPLGYVLAQALHAPLDVLLVRKLGVPGQEEVAMGGHSFRRFSFCKRRIYQSLANRGFGNSSGNRKGNAGIRAPGNFVSQRAHIDTITESTSDHSGRWYSNRRHYESGG